MKEVTEIIEVAFESAHLEKITGLLSVMLSNSTLKDYSISSDSSEINLRSKDDLITSIKGSSDGAFYFNFLDCSLNNIMLTNLGFQIIKYDNIYELYLSIDENEIRQKVSILELQTCVVSLAGELKSTSYFCGYEPAMDEETRLFSGMTLGPLKNWISIDK